VRSLLPPCEAVELATAYAVPPVPAGGHHVRVNFVASTDGASEVDGRSGALGGDGDRRVFRTLRWLTDVVLVGAGTARAEDYGPVKIPPAERARRVSAGQAPVPPIAVVTGRGDLDPASRLFAGAEARPIVLTCEAAPADRRAALAAVSEVVLCGADAIDPSAALAALGGRGLGRVLCEGGPSLYGTLASAGLADELCLTLAPVLAGPAHVGIIAGQPWRHPHDLALVHVLEEDGALFLRYRRAVSA
jgi:riboflavin biosynthesis pyrimidine reductase